MKREAEDTINSLEEEVKQSIETREEIKQEINLDN
jgi:hypothetical protein